MNEELILKYNHKKMYFRYGIIILSLLILIYAFTTIKEWHFYSLVLLIMLILGTIAYVVMTYRKIKHIPYFLKCDKNGIYTMDCFTFCPWENLKGIELKRYMGYQTLFFEVKEDNLNSKIKAIKKGKWLYYCLPMADCKGKSSDNHLQVLNYFIKHKKN